GPDAERGGGMEAALVEAPGRVPDARHGLGGHAEVARRRLGPDRGHLLERGRHAAAGEQWTAHRRRSYSALPWEKRRERPLACVALPRREPVGRVVHVERAPADGRTVAARGGQLLPRVAHRRARAPSPGLAV